MESAHTGFYDQLVGYLAAEGAVSEDQDQGVVPLTEFDHRPLPTALRLHVTPTTFDEHLRGMAPGAALLFPAVGPLEAAWRLFLVHLDEGVRTAKPGQTELVLDRSGVLAREG
ncbi:hypothetical protein EV188_103670 [Actinomycetospora succinea]|uniref:Uncharacterized protein n=1 Tax=Actinomycetospora succinea TaxID=663603 RepID=A0A4R6VEC3_9PSEU|nr:hypothetical protein [Actinomycetospora succinea]TDQ61163.1 hypothetical protein EV188_103670 [Actinomycetospora succinea]